MTNPNIEFPITVPDDLPIMDDTQLINYVVEHTCDEMRPVMMSLVYDKYENKDIVQIVTACLNLAKTDLSNLEKALDDIADAVGEINA